MENLAQPLVDGLLLGGVYALVAIGLSMMFGIVRFVNLAHGDLLILGSYLGMVFSTWLGLPPLWTILLAAPILFLVGYLLESLLVNRVLGREMEPALLVAFGISSILQNLFLLVFTPDARSIPTGLATQTIRISSTLSISVLYLVDCLVGVAVIGALHWFLQRTYLGRGIRAASDDPGAAQLVGVDTRRIYSWAMGIAMMTAAVAGVLLGMTFTFYPHTGPQYLITAFGVVVIGGLGSISGTLLGGVILATAQLLGSRFIGPGYQLLAGYVVLLVVLGVRPQGLLGKA